MRDIAFIDLLPLGKGKSPGNEVALGIPVKCYTTKKREGATFIR